MFSNDESLDHEALLPVDTPRPRRRLQRMDVALLVVISFVACFVGVRLPAQRVSNPLWHKPPPRRMFQYLTYDDIDAVKRQSGYNITYSSRGFEIDGKQTILLGGSIHYPRSSPGQWEQLLREAKRDGLNHIEMYVFWNLHERERGVYNFEGNANITRFYELAAKVGLFLHVRFGPYVCAEWSNGGLPVWLNWIPGMKVRSSNGPWEMEMERFLRYMVTLSRPFLAINGGPIIMAQIENEFSGHDPQYVEWCGQLVKRLDTSIPWIMCHANAAENTILSCNDNDCVEFAVNNVKNRPSDPLVWTEDEGWFQTWQKDKERPLPNDQRSPEDVAYAVARWFAVGGAVHNYYMYYGGNNYGRAASAGVTTKYADGVNLHFDGLSNEPKRTHLRKLHEALIECNEILLSNERQVLNPHDLPLSTGQIVNASSQQRAFIYGPKDGPNQVAFLENMANRSVNVSFGSKKIALAASSMIILKDGVILFDTADVHHSYPGLQHRTYSTLIKASSFKWTYWSELNVSLTTPRKRVIADHPVEQLQLTADQSDYLTYKTTVFLQQSSDINNKASMVEVETCEAGSIIAFLDGWLIGERSLAYPGGNCSKEFGFHLPANLNLTRQHDLMLVSVSLGIYSLGSNHSKGVTGSVRFGEKDLTKDQQWEMYPSLVGEQLEIYRPEWFHSVQWTPVHENNSTYQPNVSGGRRMLCWYATSFIYRTQQPTNYEMQKSILFDFIGLTRGRAYINGYDLGRYWLINDEGNFVQRYYHIPQDWLLKDRENLLVVFDELGGSISSSLSLPNFSKQNIGRLHNTLEIASYRAMSYMAVNSPKMGENEHYNDVVEETSKDVRQFNQVTRTIAQKMLLFGTPQDSRANHQQLTELTDRGNKLVARINRKLQELDKGAKAAGGRARKTQVAKLSLDYKNQLKSFEETCQKLLAAERAAVSNLRKSSLSFRSDDDTKLEGFDGYNEDQIYAQANVTRYNEDDLIRREEDILKINQQLHEVNAAYREVDGLVQDQGELVVDIEDNTETAQENAQGALRNVREANEKRGLCKCSKSKLICTGLFALMIIAAVIAIVAAVS
ncbi:putative target SNARE coiled-coil domain, glycoside hydrolase, family 35, syntaxin [Plasmopara halstedii]